MEEKKSTIYTYKSRIIIRSLLAIFTIMTVIFSGLSLYVVAMVGPEEIFSTGDLSSTQRYQSLVDMEIQSLQSSMGSRRPFEENGELAMDKTIDIMKPQETDKSKQNKNTTFTIEALTAMNRSGVFDGIENLDSEMGLGITGYYEMRGYSDYDVIYESEAPNEGEVPYEDEVVYEVEQDEVAPGDEYGLRFKNPEIILIDRMSALKLQKPISGTPIMEYAQDNKDDVTPLDVCIGLADVRTMMYEYDEFALQSSVAGTNLRYFIKDNESNQIVTNGGWETIEEARKAAREWGIIIEYKRNSKGFEITKDSSPGFEVAKQGVKYQPLMSKVEEVVITVDKSYPISDQLSEFSYGYTHLKPSFEKFLVLAIISLIGLIVCLILATVTTGQDKKKGTVYLNMFDKIPTEISAAIVCLLGIIDIASNAWLYDNIAYGYSNTVVRLGFMIFAMIQVAFIATWGYLSLVRRIKAKDLWKNSLLRRVIYALKKIYSMGKISTRMVTVFVAFVLVNAFLAVIFGIMGIVALAVIDTAVLIRLLKETQQRQIVKGGLDTIAEGNLEYKLDTTNLQQDNKEMAESANKIAAGMQKAIVKSMKNERMRSELITNVSHDIKTPLTSIINYVDLLKREDIQNPQVKGYIDILDAKSQRLKHLTEDLVEASKVSSGNVELHMDKINVQELLVQAEGEFSEKLNDRQLELVSTLAKEPLIIEADGRQMWRIFENLLNNISKYALEGTRVYIDLVEKNKKMTLEFKNMSQEALNINADELTERFVRGDISRTTEGSGLGLSIAKSLTELQGGKFDIYLDGD